MMAQRIGGLLLLASLAAPAHAGEKYALLVGVKDYPEEKELRPLPFSEKDVTTLAGVLQNRGFLKHNIVLMTQARGVEGGRFIPLKNRIEAELKLLLNGRTADDTVLIALAGHGVHLKKDKKSYFCPADAQLNSTDKLVSLEDIYEKLEACKAGVRVLLVDACRNDPLIDNSRAGRPESDLESVTRPELPEPPRGVAAYFSCSEKERAFESPELRHGVFFYYVIEGLKEKAANEDGNVSMLGLGNFVSPKVKDYVRARFGVIQSPDLKGRNLSETSLFHMGKLFGKWNGTYFYPDGDPRPGVGFEMRIVPNGPVFTGETTEANTFWMNDPTVDRTKPQLFGRCRGDFNEARRQVTWVKTYDGTANVSHSVEYNGVLSADGREISGTWAIRNPGEPVFSGRFTLKKAAR